MPYKRSSLTPAPGVWLAVALLVVIACLTYPNLVSAQQDSSLTPPTLSGRATANGVELSWTAITGAARYELWVWDSVNGWLQLGGNTLSGTGYTHTGVAAGVTYWYTVRAVNAVEQASAWSEYVTVAASGSQTQTLTPTPSAQAKLDPKHTSTPTVAPTASQTTVLTAPTLSGRATANGVELSWTAITGAARYELWVWDSVNGWLQLGGNTLSGTSYTHTDAADGTTYWYAVRAVNAVEQASAWSEYVTVAASGPQTQTLTPTSTPTATPTASSKVGAPITRTETIVPEFDWVEDSIVVTWDAPASGSVSHYILTRTHDDNGVTITKTIRVDGTSTSYIDNDVEFIYYYDYVVTAYLEESAATATPTASQTTVLIAPTPTPTSTPLGGSTPTSTPSAQAKLNSKYTSTPTATPTASQTTVLTALTPTPTPTPTATQSTLGAPTLSGQVVSATSVTLLRRDRIKGRRDVPHFWRTRIQKGDAVLWLLHVMDFWRSLLSIRVLRDPSEPRRPRRWKRT